LKAAEEHVVLVARRVEKAEVRRRAADVVLREALKSRLRAHKVESGFRCAACGSTPSAAQLVVHRREIDEKLAEVTRELRVCREVSERFKEKEVPEARAACRRCRDKQVALTAETSAVDRTAEKRATAKKGLVQARLRVADLERKLTSARGQQSEALRCLQRDVRKARKRVARLERSLQGLAADLAHQRFWLEGFGNRGVKSYYLDYVVPLLNERAAYYASLLATDVRVAFNTESATAKGELRDRFRVSVVNKRGAAHYGGNSAGERRKVDIVVARALQSLLEGRGQAATNLLWYDEVFESLDAGSVEAVIGMLREDAKRYGTVFVVSHQEWLQDYFPRALRVVKRRGFSVVESAE
jgi:DNA repair exonuclease SbcCD ATPase subunit